MPKLSFIYDQNSLYYRMGHSKTNQHPTPKFQKHGQRRKKNTKQHSIISTDQLELIRSLQFGEATLRGPDTWNAYGWASSFTSAVAISLVGANVISAAPIFAIKTKMAFLLFFFFILLQNFILQMHWEREAFVLVCGVLVFFLSFKSFCLVMGIWFEEEAQFQFH